MQDLTFLRGEHTLGGPSKNEEASHIVEFCVQREVSGGPCQEIFLAKQ